MKDLKTITWYLAGPMTNIPQMNFPAFDTAASALRKEGYTIQSPAELDSPETRRLALASPDGAPGSGSANGETWGDFLARDVKLIADGVGGIVVLPNWHASRGALLEVFVALLNKYPIGEYQERNSRATIEPLPTGWVKHLLISSNKLTNYIGEL